MTDPELRFVVALARQVVMHRGRFGDIPKAGDLVVEVTGMRVDPDAIGWMVACGDARSSDLVPWYSIKPLSGRGDGDSETRRWVNCQFVAIPDFISKLILLP